MIDAYNVLGISKDADDTIVKKAFRKLAKKYHPDTSKEPNAESKFKEVNEAQRILNDPQEKMRHDIENGYVQRPRSHSHGFPFGSGGIEDFFSDMFGHQNPFHHQRRSHQRPIMNVGVQLTLEEIYSGVKKLLSINGRQLEIDIPPGCQNGEVFGIDVENVHVRIQIQEIKHPTVKREGLTLKKEVRVPLDKAVLGGDVRIEILGAIKSVTIPPGTGSHKIIRVKGAGLVPGNTRGDLHLSVRIDIHREGIERLRAAWDQGS